MRGWCHRGNQQCRQRERGDRQQASKSAFTRSKLEHSISYQDMTGMAFRTASLVALLPDAEGYDDGR
jgi:hypothetical protein